MQIGVALAAGMPPVEQLYKEVLFAQQKVFGYFFKKVTSISYFH
ncbi:hypothetical protein NRA16_16465 [Acinetobacter baumannii]|nr:hypothetical protein [Acinetobacter baumannii]